MWAFGHIGPAQPVQSHQESVGEHHANQAGIVAGVSGLHELEIHHNKEYPKGDRSLYISLSNFRGYTSIPYPKNGGVATNHDLLWKLAN